MSIPADLTLVQAGAQLRDGRLKVRDLLRATEQRRRASSDLDAWAFVRDDDVLQADADRLQRDLDAGRPVDPVHGIPFGAKDLVHTADLPTEAGSATLRGHRPDADASCLAQVRGRGGLLVGKTRTHEFAYGVTTPPVRNPWDRSRTPGGSSGGSAAAVAAGSCLWAIGTDTLGSVRMPAALCGVVGLKPSYGAVDTTGVLPLAWSLDHVGVLARSSADAAAGYRALRRPDAAAHPAPQRPLRIGVLHHDDLGPVDPDVSRVLDDVAQHLAGEHTVQPIRLPLLRHDVAVGFGILAPEAASWHQPRLARHLVQDGQDYHPRIRAMLEAGLAVPAVDYLRARRAAGPIADQWRQLLSQVDVVLLPTVPYLAPAFDADTVTWPDGSTEPVATSMCRFTAGSNVTGLPSLTVPAGLGAGPHGPLPVGVQLVAATGQEALLLRLGTDVEGGRPPLGSPPTTQESS